MKYPPLSASIRGEEVLQQKLLSLPNHPSRLLARSEQLKGATVVRNGSSEPRAPSGIHRAGGFYLQQVWKIVSTRVRPRLGILLRTLLLHGDFQTDGHRRL